MFEIVKNYRDNEELRHSFNDLAGKTFGLNFEDWYQNGFWTDNYNPYSVVSDGRVVANVSVNHTDMEINGAVKHFLQLGTVMTEEAYRNRGLSRKIMEQIEVDFDGKVDGYYLFGNDSVLDFYPRFGFRKAKEYQYAKKVSNKGEAQVKRVIMNNPESWEQLQDVMRRNVFGGRFDMVNNSELIMFYVTKFMQEDVYYHEATDTYVIAEAEEGKLFIHNVFSTTLEDLDEVIALFGADIKEVTLGFVPMEAEGYTVTEYHEEDCTFFIKGEALNVVETDKLRIPTLSHA
ncbi:MAG: GNAT family N-acetyltransferase [Lachnospiraceae bacterium]|nr:GNAT family N-acetyltransferase [Lachnospiraceae bacterium]